jgi:hypothetical protein
MAWALRNAMFGSADNYLLQLLRSFYHGVANAGSPEAAIVNLSHQVINGLAGEAVF